MSERSDKIGKTNLSDRSMDIAEVLKLADELLFTHTGDRLDHLQETIIKGTLQGQKYAKIASGNHLSEGHVRDTASKLWQNLSDVLGEDVNKLNVGNILEKIIISNSGSIGYLVNGNKVSICSERRRSPKSSPFSKQTETKHNLDLDTAPIITTFYGRTEEINKLKTWIIEPHTRIITLLGIPGIGKTTLAIKLIEEIPDQFQYIIYRSLRFCPNIDTFLTDLLQTSFAFSTLPNTLDQKITQFLKILRQYRCLIILDDLQMLFQPGQFAGQYQAEFEGYYLLFKQIAESSHPSCLFLISSEQPECLTSDRSKFVQLLKLSGLGESATEILKDKELLDEEHWHDLIEKYQGHPLWLEMTATMIHELFAGKVTEFLTYPSLILSNEITSQLNRLWIKLTDAEKQVMNYLAKQEDAVTLIQILQSISHPPTEVLKAIQSLKIRCLLEDTPNCDRSSLLKINSILKSYITSPLIK